MKIELPPTNHPGEKTVVPLVIDGWRIDVYRDEKGKVETIKILKDMERPSLIR
jgi:hypothetical protein